MKLSSTNITCIIISSIIMIGCVFTSSIITGGFKYIQIQNQKTSNVGVIHSSQKFTKQITAKYSGVVLIPNNEAIHDIKVIIDDREYIVPYGYDTLDKDVSLGDILDVLITYHTIYIIKPNSNIVASTIDSVEMVL